MAILLLALGLACADAAVARTDPAQVCRDAAIAASRATGVPVEVLMAVSLTETGRRRDGRTVTWPWTLNIAGDGHWLDSPGEALALAEGARSRGLSNFDVGCFQLNYRWHGEAFASLSEMLSPEANARYAADFLVALKAELGDWSRAAGAYHSRTPHHAARYRKTFDVHYAALQRDGVPAPAAPAVDTRPNSYPLLLAGDGRPLMGSLVPLGQGGGVRPLFSAARPLWGG